MSAEALPVSGTVGLAEGATLDFDIRPTTEEGAPVGAMTVGVSRFDDVGPGNVLFGVPGDLLDTP